MAIATRPAEVRRVPVQKRVEVCLDLQVEARRLIELSDSRDQLVLRKRYDDATVVHRAIAAELRSHLQNLIDVTPLLTGEWPEYRHGGIR